MATLCVHTLCRMFNTICTPYNGEDLVWHPVTPSMSSMAYQSPDASQNVELKKGNIASFFKPQGSKQPAKPTVRSGQTTDVAADNPAPQVTSTSREVLPSVKAEPASQHSKTAQISSDALPMSGGTQSQHMLSNQQFSADKSSEVSAEGGIVDLVKDDHRPEAAADDILNTDDAGGIGNATNIPCTLCFATTVLT